MAAILRGGGDQVLTANLRDPPISRAPFAGFYCIQTPKNLTLSIIKRVLEKTFSNLINCRYFNWPFFDLVSLCGLSLSSASFTRNSLTFPSSPDDSLHSTNEYSLCSLLSYRTTFWTSWTRSKQKKLEILMKR